MANIAVWLAAIGIFGCVSEPVDAGFRVTWSITDENEEPMTCLEARASTVSIEVIDSEQNHHEYVSACVADVFETSTWDIATGQGHVRLALLSDEGEVVATAPEIVFDFSSGLLRNELSQTFVVAFSSPGQTTGVTWYWRIWDSDGKSVQCDNVGAAFLRFSLDDAAGSHHDLAILPCRAAAGHRIQTDDLIAPGNALYEIGLLNQRQEEIETFQFDIDISDDPGDLEISVATLEVTPFFLGGDAGITWEWRYGDAYFTEEICQALDIDYGLVWVWHDAFGEWWTDYRLAKIGCGAFDHPDDNVVWDDEIYSGLFLSSFLDPGEHRLMLGLYRAAEPFEPADVMMFHDIKEKGADDSATLTSNDASPYNTNLLTSVVDPNALPVSGVLRIALQWTSDEETMLTTCETARISEMGFVLSNRDVPAAEMPYGFGNPCRDWLELEKVPVLADPYELLVSGISVENEISYYAVCEGIVPEPGVTLDESNGYICEVAPQ